MLPILLVILTWNTPLALANESHYKRQYINNPLLIDRWSGPFFNNEQQNIAFKQLAGNVVMKGDVTGTKRMELQGFDPDKILNPVPIKEKKKVIKDEGPVAETYIGKNPYADRTEVISPQERLASLVSDPIIHEETFEPAKKKNKQENEITKKVKHFKNFQQRKFSKTPQSQGLGTHELNEAKKLLFQRTPEFEHEMYRNRESERENYGSMSEEEAHNQFGRGEGQSRNFDESMDHGNEFDWQNKEDEDRGVRNQEEHEEEDEEGDHGHEDDEHEDYDHEDHDGVDHEDVEGEGEYHDEGDFHHNGNDREHAYDNEGSNEKLNHEIENELNIHRAKHPSLTDQDYQSEKAYMNYLHQYKGRQLMDNKRFQIHAGKRSKIITNNKYGTFSSAKASSLIDKNIAPKFISVNHTPAGKSLSILGGESDINSLPESLLGQAGVGLNSHSGVLEMSKVGAQSVIPITGEGLHSLPLHGSATAANGAESGETIFQTTSNNHNIFPPKEDIDADTIFLSHHKNNKTNETNKNNHLKNIKRTKFNSVKNRINKRSHSRQRKSKFSKAVIDSRRDAIANPSNSNKRWGHSTDHRGGIMEDNVSYTYHHPHLMTIGTHDPSDIHKVWNNMHSPGNGFYSGSGVGPARTMEGEYIQHNQHEAPANIGGDYFEGSDLNIPVGQVGRSRHNMYGESSDPVHSLSASDAHTDHETAGIIDAIWEHDYEGRVGRGHHHRKEGMLGFFGHTDQNALLPAETLDGIAEHWEHVGHHGMNDHVLGDEGLPHIPQPVVHNTEVENGRYGSIQDIQDDPNIDTEMQTMGIGMAMNGHHGTHHMFLGHTGVGHHGVGTPYVEPHHVGGYASQFHGVHALLHPYALGTHDALGSHVMMGALDGHADHIPVDILHHPEMSPEEYHNHIDALMLKYHQLEEDMRGQHGELMEQVDENLLHQHGQPHYHSGFDMYAYRNPWDNAQLPYHVPVENHPEVMNNGAEKGGPLVEAKVEGKPEEPKTEAKPEEAKTEDKASAPVPKPTLDQKLDAALTREEDKPTEKPKEAPPTPVNGPDWYGNPPKVPQQRGGPDESGSIGLEANESIADTIQASIKDGDLASLKQAVQAYKTLNLTVPPDIQIAELKAELKAAQAKTEAEESAKQQPANQAPVTSQVNPIQAALMASLVASQKVAPNPISPSARLQQNAATKGKKPDQNLSTADKIIQALAAKNLLSEQGNTPKAHPLPVIAMSQPSYVKQILEKAAKTTKENQKDVSRGETNAANLLLKSPPPLPIQNKVITSQQLLSFLELNKNNDKQSSNDKPISIASAYSAKSIAAGTPQNPALEKVLDDLILKTQKEKVDKARSTEKKEADSDDAPTLEPDDSPTTSDITKDQNSADLISLLNNAASIKKRKHHKKKSSKQTENAYARIGYEPQDSDVTYKVGIKKTSNGLDSVKETTVSDTVNASLRSSPLVMDEETEENGYETKKKRTSKPKGNTKRKGVL